MGVIEWIEEIQPCAHHLSTMDQAFCIFDYLEGEAREEIKYCRSAEREDPVKVLAILMELYGYAQSYVTFQQAFFSHRQGEMLQKFSLALLALMELVKQCASEGMVNVNVLICDQFVEHVLDDMQS